ncbi:MAG: restriction endonuclease [Candidatus Altiarchaeota archaeon]|nr:restriction endonuclease [Candidatus Altiarchaeota archaeon]
MNEWIQRSIKLANSRGYLDKLDQVYPVSINTRRPLPPSLKKELKTLFDGKDKEGLIRLLVTLDKFPIKDPYVAFLKRDKKAIDLNPKTVERLADRLHSMGFNTLLKGIEEPKEFNRQIGTLFRRFLPDLGYPVLSLEEFDEFDGIAFLDCSDAELKNYANKKLKCRLSKGLDLLAKVHDTHVIGEAKFLTDFGGHQNAQFEDGLRLIKSSAGNAVRVAVLDGVVWIDGTKKMHRKVREQTAPVFSALLLGDFLESLG